MADLGAGKHHCVVDLGAAENRVGAERTVGADERILEHRAISDRDWTVNNAV